MAAGILVPTKYFFSFKMYFKTLPDTGPVVLFMPKHKRAWARVTLVHTSSHHSTVASQQRTTKKTLLFFFAYFVYLTFLDFLIMQGGVVHMITLHAQSAHPCLCITNCSVPKYSSLNHCQGSVPCLSTVWSACTSQTNWTFGDKFAWAQYVLPSASAP